MSHVVMRHKVTGGVARIAAGAVPHARTRGWKTVPTRQATNVPDTSPETPAAEPDTTEQEPDSGRNEE